MSEIPVLPPTHVIDQPGCWISPHDPAWDHERLRRELEALPEERDRLRHPVTRYYVGESRFQLQAPTWSVEGKPCTVSEYLRPGVAPSRFALQRPKRKRLRAIEAIDDVWERREAWIRGVVRGISGPEGQLCWTPTGDDEVPDEVLEALAQWSPTLVRQLADACAKFCAPLFESESFRIAVVGLAPRPEPDSQREED